MANEFIRNAEGYYDPTAGTALEKVRRERAIMDIKAYDIIKTTRSNGRDKRFLNSFISSWFSDLNAIIAPLTGMDKNVLFDCE